MTIPSLPTRHCDPDPDIKQTVPHQGFPPVITLPAARARDLMSKSAWAARGRVLKERAEPSGIVSQAEAKAKGRGIHPVVRDLGNDIYVISTRYYEVYEEVQTVPKKGDERRKRSLSSRLSPHPSSLVSPERRATDGNALNFEATVTLSDFEISLTPQGGANKEAWAYVPTFIPDKDKTDLGVDLELAYCVMHLLYFFRVRSQKGREEWIELSRDFCVNRFGGRSGANWYRVRDKMLCLKIMYKKEMEVRQDEYGLGIEVVTPRGVEGHRCFGYRLRDDLRATKTRRTVLTDPLAVKVSLGDRAGGHVPRWLEGNLHRVTIESVPADTLREIARRDDDPASTPEDKADAYAETLRWIAEGSWIFERDDFSGRIHTNLTGLKRELRPYLRVGGQPLCQIDIPCSQLAFIALVARRAERQYRRKFVDDHFFEVWERDLYAHLGDKLGLPRKEVKLHLTQRALFSSNRSPYQRHAVKKMFDREFPLLASYLKLVKDYEPKPDDDEDTKRKPYRVLAQKAQTAERQFVIDTVCRRLRRERREMWASTIHDSVLVLRGDAEYTRMVMLDEFDKLGLHPNLKIEDYAESQAP